MWVSSLHLVAKGLAPLLDQVCAGWNGRGESLQRLALRALWQRDLPVNRSIADHIGQKV